VSLCGWLAGGSLPGDAQNQAQLIQNQTQQAVPASLHVTGTATRFTVSAFRADVQEVLKLVFDQAGKQFVVDKEVTGQVTLRLTGQPLEYVLQAICQQTLLTYRLDMRSSVYRFMRDDEAIKNAFARMRAVDSLLREQLRNLGYDPSALPMVGRMNNQNLLQSRAGGYGGAGQGLTNGGYPQTAQKVGAYPRGSSDPRAQSVMRNAMPVSPGNADAIPTAPYSGAIRNENYANFLKDNSLVTLRVAKEKPEPVAEVLLNLAKQANVPMLLDPALTSDTRFRFTGTIPPRPLPDALNTLTFLARLEWRWVGNTVYVTPAPDFALYFGDLKDPAAVYQAPGARARTQGQAGQGGPPAPGEAAPKTDTKDKNKPQE
jgi:hypothetical protein